MSKDVNNQNYLPDFSVHMAEGFYQVGYSVARSFHEDDKGSDFIFLAPAVVNFNMAVELYLKALHLFLNRRLKSGHHLWELFKSLPPEWKPVIEEKYSIAQASQKVVLSGYIFSVSRASGNEQRTAPVKHRFNTVKELLLVHNDAFEKWRYLHELKKEEGYEYQYDFDSMNSFCQTIRELCYDLIKTRGPRMGMERVKKE